MNNMTDKANRIEDIDDILQGAGLPAHIALISVKAISVGHSLKKGEENVGIVDALIDVEVAFDAGYTIGAEYRYESSTPVHEVHTMEGLVDYVKNGAFDFNINFINDDEKPYDNWWIRVDENEAVLSEILEVFNQADVVESYGELGEAFGSQWTETCREIAYGLMGYLDARNTNLKNNPIPAGRFDSMVREAIIAFMYESED